MLAPIFDDQTDGIFGHSKGFVLGICVRHHLGQFGDAYQEAALVLRFYEDLSERQVAEILNCRPGTVKSLVSRGLETLRNEIRGEHR